MFHVKHFVKMVNYELNDSGNYVVNIKLVDVLFKI